MKGLFYDLRDFSISIGDLFFNAAVWIENNTTLTGLIDPFHDIASFFYDVAYGCRLIGDELDDWWDEITQAVSDINYLNLDIDNLISWVRNVPVEISNYVNLQIDDLIGWIQNVPGEISTYVLTRIDEVKLWVNTVIPDIMAWIQSNAEAVYNAIKGFIDELVFVAATYAADIWDAVVGFAGDAIALALAPFADLYNWFELSKELVVGFFNEPLSYILSWLEGIIGEHEDQLVSIASRIGEALFHPTDEGD